MKKVKKVLSVVLAVGMVMAAFCGCGSNDSSASTSADQGKETLVMATNATFPPYEYVENGDYEGIDIEIAKKIADELGMELVIEDVEFGSIVAGVQSNKYDIGMAGMTVTEDRKKSVNFSDSYAYAVQSIIVASGSDIKSADDITSDTIIGVQQDTTGDIYVSDDYADNEIVRYKSGADAVQALATGKVDCVVIDNEPAKSYVASNDNLEILDTAYAEEEYAIAVAKENEELLSKINDALAKLKADGTLDEIVNKYITED